MAYYHDLPEDPEEQFIYLEGMYRSEIRNEQDVDGNDYIPRQEMALYMTKVMAAHDECSLDVLDSWGRVRYEDVSDTSFFNFQLDVNRYLHSAKIRISRRGKGYSIVFDSVTKTTIHEHIGKIREIVDHAEMSEGHRRRLLEKLNAFSAEIDRDRSRLEAFGELMVEAAGYFGKAVEKARVLELLEEVAVVMHGARARQKQLPPPKEPRKIEHKPKLSTDDDIPF